MLFWQPGFSDSEIFVNALVLVTMLVLQGTLRGARYLCERGFACTPMQPPVVTPPKPKHASSSKESKKTSPSLGVCRICDLDDSTNQLSNSCEHQTSAEASRTESSEHDASMQAPGCSSDSAAAPTSKAHSETAAQIATLESQIRACQKDLESLNNPSSFVEYATRTRSINVMKRMIRALREQESRDQAQQLQHAVSPDSGSVGQEGFFSGGKRQLSTDRTPLHSVLRWLVFGRFGAVLLLYIVAKIVLPADVKHFVTWRTLTGSSLIGNTAVEYLSSRGKRHIAQ